MSDPDLILAHDCICFPIVELVTCNVKYVVIAVVNNFLFWRCEVKGKDGRVFTDRNSICRVSYLMDFNEGLIERSNATR